MADSAQEKTQEPTPRRKSKARQQGQVAKSNEIGSAVVLFAGIITLMLIGSVMAERIRWIFQAIFNNLNTIPVEPDSIAEYARQGGNFFFKLMAPFGIVVILAGLAMGEAQTRFLFTLKPLQPKLDRLDPIKGFKRIFGSRGWMELAKGLAKFAIVGIVGYITIRQEMNKFLPLMDQDVLGIVTGMTASMFKLALRLAFAILIIGIIDMRFQHYKHNKDLKMTKQEVKDEHKMTEGDPQVKSKIRQIQFRASLNRMIKKLPEADVVLTNPTHVAVALKYDSKTMAAPVVIAKGKRKLAQKIKAIAAEHDIPIFEEPELARALYRTTEVGMFIPYDLFQAVAEILAMVYRLREAA